MKRAHPPVIAAIPVYNMAGSLAELLPEVLAQGYDAVYVLDDCSADDSVRVAEQLAGVQVIKGNKNVGAGNNRNRIFQAKNQWPDAIIHFLDADVQLISKDNPAVIRGIFADSAIGVAGGLIVDTKGVQSAYNFGPRPSVSSSITIWPQVWAHFVSRHFRKQNPRRLPPTWRRWPSIFAKPVARDTFYVCEGNMCIPMKLLMQFGGFDPALREHESQDLAYKVAKAGLKTRFDPELAVRHLAIDVRGPKRYYKDQWVALFRVVRKHGLPLR
jgi:GT2 family glycosyltransferase